MPVHYVGTLYPDDITFDSSRDKNVPFTFDLGQGQVIKGWDEGVKTMRVGEVAELICSPEYGRIGVFFIFEFDLPASRINETKGFIFADSLRNTRAASSYTRKRDVKV